MTYTAISDFKYGMDRRRPQSSGVPGTLWNLKNAVITRGGDIERAKKFDPIYGLPDGTFGYFSVRNQKYVFGSGTTPGGMPVGVRYQQLSAPGTPAMIDVLDAKAFDGKVYAIAAYADGNLYHFYNGTRVSDWDTLADSAASFETVAKRLAGLIDAQSAFKAEAFGATVEITAAVPGTGFTISGSTTDNGGVSTPTATATAVQANVAAVAEVRPTGTIAITGGSASPGVNKITSATVDGTELLGNAVDWVGSNSGTANALAVEINNGTHGYTASAVGAVVTITAAVGVGATGNGDVVDATEAGNVTTSTANMSGGVTKVDAVAQVHKVVIAGGSFDSVDLWKITLNGTVYQTTGRASATGTALLVNKNRVNSVAGPLIRGCKLNDATDWTDPNASSGAFFINVANDVDGAETLYGMAHYDDLVAVFGRDVIVTYELFADVSKNNRVQVIPNTGTIAPRSVVAYGASDTYYLDETGIRSLRTRDNTAAAYASDIGSAIDPFMQEIFAEVGEYVRSKSCAVIEAVDGRYMLAIGQYVVVLSQFPSSKIVAWSFIDFEADISDMVRVGRSIQLRAGNTIYAYGGASASVYPDAGEFKVLVETPFITSKDPAGEKTLEGFDMAAENTWKVQILPNPNDPTKFIDAGRYDGVTYAEADAKVPGQSTHFALRMTCDAEGFASLSSTAIHSSRGEQH